MARKKKPEDHENHERWLISYADFVTLLFAFFVVMFASSNMDKEKAKQVSESVVNAINESHVAAAVSAVLGGGNVRRVGKSVTKAPKPDEAAPAVVVELLPSLEFLTQALEAEIRAGKLKLTLESRGLVVSLLQATFFPSGQDTIEAATFPSLAKIAGVVRKLPNPVRLEGHTDSVPISNPRFRSNWELSAARSIAMMELLTTRFEIPKGRIMIAGYADNVPVGSNETEEGRAQNRRVDLVILGSKGLASEPAHAPQKPGPAAAPHGK
ncbi:MAG: flagellar motor protein MotB [Bryobacterales bacterium]|nr:flagellar motor protein MotB [Bryobacterales bacterium]